MENFENVNTKAGELLRGLMSEEAVHGLGRERFNESQRVEIEALFTRVGVPMEDHILDNLHSSTVMDMVEYAQGGLEQEDKVILAKDIQAQIVEALHRAGDEGVEFEKAA